MFDDNVSQVDLLRWANFVTDRFFGTTLDPKQLVNALTDFMIMEEDSSFNGQEDGRVPPE